MRMVGTSPNKTSRSQKGAAMKFVWWIVLALVAIVLILFAISNRQTVSVGLWPLPALVDMPLYLVLLGTLLVGFIVGELVAWIRGWHWRREARRSRDRIATLEREIAAAHAQRPEAPAPLAALPR
jgi:putative membrane protein